MQSGYAQYYGQPPFNGTPSCNDGLGDSQSGGSGGSCSKTVYGVSSPSGNTIILKLSGAQASINPVNVNSSSFYSTVDWQVDDYLVTVALTGQNTAGQALTGQQIQATVLMPNGLPSGTTITKYTWSFTGGTKGNPIKNWDPKGVAVDGTTPQQLFAFLNADLSQTDTTGNGLSGVNPILFYDEADKDAVTAKCVVSLTFPDGTTSSVTAKSSTVTFLKPTGNWSVAAPVSYVDSGTFGVNEVWNPDTITVPFGGGMGCFVQLITPSGQVSRTPPPGVSIMAAPPYYLKVPDGKGGWQLPSNGLDSGFPYPYGYVVNSDGSLGAAVNTGYTWDVSGKGASGDRPGQPYNPSLVTGDSGGNNWYSATMQNTFTTWMMFKPNTPNAIWVPLMTLSWSANVTVSNTSGSWAVVPDGGTSSPPTPTKTDTPPSWTSVNNASVAKMRP
jgi:hypothetical protein